MSPPLRVAVIGYGTGGQATALLLSRDGHAVSVFERVPEPGPVGAGFLLQPVGLAVLWELGLLDAVLAHGAAIRRLYGESTRARPVLDIRYRELHPQLFGLGLQRGALFALLDAAWQQGRHLQSGCTIQHVDAENGRITDSQGQRQDGFDLIVIADGAASTLRAQVATAQLDRPYPWGAYWCLVEQGNWPWQDELQQRYRAARRMVGMLPVGTRPGDAHARMSFFWSAPISELDAGIADGQGWRDAVASIWPQAADYLQHTDVPAGLAVARYRDAVHRHWHSGRCVLLGDAAHAMSPQLGQGVNMALLDAQALRDALRAQNAVPAALQAYQQQRRQHLAAYHFWSRWLTPLFQSEHDWAAACRDRWMHPLSRLPLARGQMLRVLSGTRKGWLGHFALPSGFMDALKTRSLPAV